MAKPFFQEPEFRKYFFWAVVAILLVLAYKILKPFFVALISAFILAYLTRPVHVRLEKVIGKRLSALIIVVVVTLILILPAGLIIGGIVQQAHSYFTGGSFEELLETISSSPFLGKVVEDLGLFNAEGSISFSPILSILTSVITYVPSLVLSLFITLFGMYFISSSSKTGKTAEKAKLAPKSVHVSINL